MEFLLLGPLEVRDRGRVVDLGGPKPRALLAILLVHAGEDVSRDQLVDDLWGEAPPRSAHHLLHVYVSGLRKALQPTGGEASRRMVITRPPGYRLEVDTDDLDSRRFERLLREGRHLLATGDPGRASVALREAVGLWRGCALVDFLYEPFAQAEIARLEELRLVAVEEKIEADLALGRHSELVGELGALVTESPLRERPRGQLMLALYRSGRQAEALAAYSEGRRVLVEELGIEPGLSLQRLQRAILRQDAELELARETKTAPAEAVRKLVTVVVAGVAESADLERVDPERRRAAVARVLDTTTTVLRRHGATVQRSFGDSVMGVFGVPEAHEDDALRCARASVEVREALAAQDKLHRDGGIAASSGLGIETGEAVVEGDSVHGEAVGTAVRLSQAARPGEALLGETTYRLVRHAVLAETLDARAATGAVSGPRRLLAVLPEAPAFPRPFDSPLVGRQRELGQLRQALAEAVRKKTARLVTVVGEAGVGKSRLVQEFASSLGAEATPLIGRCISYGEGITFWPLKELVRQMAGAETREAVLRLLHDGDEGELLAGLIAAAIGGGQTAERPEETFRAFRRLLEEGARARPLLLIFEDIHWGEPTFLDLVEYLAARTREAPVLVLCLARPELLEERPSWSEVVPNAATLPLEALSEAESQALVDNLPREMRLPREARSRIVAAGEGNPFFLEQMLAMLTEQQHSQDELALPPTIRAVLAARLDRLGPAERATLERASVAGREFSQDAVAALLPEQARPHVRRHLITLLRKDYIRSDRPDPQRGGAFRFRHVLIQEAAYRGVPKEIRGELHERLANWLEQQLAERVEENVEIVGYHLERAWRYRTELAPAAEHENELAARAAERLWTAARRSSAQLDFPAAVNLYGRAASLLPDEETGGLLQEFGSALIRNMEHERADAVLVRAIVQASAGHEVRAEIHARLDRYGIRVSSDGSVGEMSRDVEPLIPTLEQLDDHLGLTKAWWLLAFGQWALCSFGAQKELLERGLLHARRCGDRLEEAEILVDLLDASYLGATPVEDGMDQCERSLRDLGGDRRVEAKALAVGGALRAMLGRFDEARELLVQGMTIWKDLGIQGWMPAIELSDLEMLAGDPSAAEQWLRMEEANTPDALMRFRSLTTAQLARAVCAQGRYEEAERLAKISERFASDWVRDQVLWRTAQARALAARHELDEAERLARDAVSLAAQTDALNMHGDALMDLAKVLRLAAGVAKALTVLEEASRLYQRKGNLVMVGKASAAIHHLAGNH